MLNYDVLMVNTTRPTDRRIGRVYWVVSESNSP